MKKVIYAIRSKAHFSYHESSVNALLDAGADVLIAFDEYWSNYGNPSHVAYEAWRESHRDVDVVYFPIRAGILRKPMFFLRELRSYNNYCRRGEEYEFYRNRWSNYLKLPKKVHHIISSQKMRPYMGSLMLRKMLTAVECMVPPDKEIMRWLSKQNAGVLIASPCNMRYSQETELVKAANKLKIPTVIPVLSWDNTSTKGLFHIFPNRLLAWHEGHKKDCMEFHGMPEKTIAIVGSPFFDKWFERKAPPITYEAFCQRVGLDASRPYILYLGSSANIALDETWFVRDMQEALKNHADARIRNMQILYRSHPANWKNALNLESDVIKVWPKEGTLPDTQETFEDFRDSLDHAMCVVGINTSGMLDAIINHKPLISPLIEKYQYTQEKAEHFKRMRDMHALVIAKDAPDVANKVLDLLEGRDETAKQREAFVLKYVRPCGLDVSAGSRVAGEALQIASKGTMVGEKSDNANLNALIDTVPKKNMETDIKKIFANFFERIEDARQSKHFKFYQATRDKILNMMGSYKASSYWYEEIEGFDYLFDAPPLIVTKIREHCYHITGEKSYIYRSHHSHKAKPYLERLTELKALDKSNLFVPEDPACGGFGHMSHLGMVNLDTLKFYEVLVGLDKAGCLDAFKNATDRKMAFEIGSGWGGFAYQFKKLFPNTTIVCIDLPATLLFSCTYLSGAMPDAKIGIWGDAPAKEMLANWKNYDFIMIPADKLSEFKPAQLDLTVNMCSFQEMTTEQVREYVHHVADLKCQRLYSLNRDRSPHNPELSLVSEIMKERYKTQLIPMLATEYCMVGSKVKPKLGQNILDNPATYRHIAGKLA